LCWINKRILKPTDFALAPMSPQLAGDHRWHDREQLSGARVPFYGTTADRLSQELILADGTIEQIGPAHDTLPAQRELIDLITAHAAKSAGMPPGLQKRWSGYALERWLRSRQSQRHAAARERWRRSFPPN
jgi:hypothetical protein